jgi:hypothetical protein
MNRWLATDRTEAFIPALDRRAGLVGCQCIQKKANYADSLAQGVAQIGLSLS